MDINTLPEDALENAFKAVEITTKEEAEKIEIAIKEGRISLRSFLNLLKSNKQKQS